MARKPTYEELEKRVKELEKEAEKRKLTEEALKIRGEMLSAIVDQSPIPTAIGGSNGAIISFNESLVELIGYRRDEITNVTDWANRLYPDEEYRGFVWNNIQQALRGEKQENTEFKITHKDGTIRTVDFHTSFFEDGLIIQMVDITERKQAEEMLKDREKKLEIKSINLEEANTALKVLLNRVEEDKKELENKILLNIKGMVDPCLEKLKRTDLNGKQQTYLSILETNLSDIASPFAYRLTSAYFSLTPKEMDVANLVKQGKANKEIADLMNISARTVEIHRERIRKKLGIRGKKTNLRTHLLSFQ
jgi:PAS domain S-box-containing protein